MLSPGDRLGPYEVLAPLGAGGMGEVYRARDTRLGREVAVKVLREEVSSDPERLRRFEREARAVAALNHPHILAVYDIGSEKGLAYLVFELLEGQTLRGLLRSGRQPARKVVDYGVQVCRGLAAAHERGVVHRDLKPENVFLTGDGQVKILDFGLARRSSSPGEALASEASAETASAPGQVMGTVGYMSPEQARGEPVDVRSDLFSLGAILYELLSGRRAFTGRSSADILAAILHSDPPEIGTSGVAPVPPALEAVVRRCLEKNPRDRFHSAHDLTLALETLSAALPVSGGRERAGRVGALAIVTGVLLVGGALGWGYWRHRASVTPGEPIRATPFTSDGGQKHAPSLSPDGERVAYQWSGAADDNWDIYVKALGVGARPLRLTQHAANDTVPAWSPDGRQIAFVRELGEQAAIFTVPSSGGPERKLTDIRHPADAARTGALFRQGALAWSPDGEWLVFAERSSKEGPSRVVRFSLATGERETLTWPPDEGTQGDFCPALSPDGTELAFVRSESSTWGLKDVWVQPVGSGKARRLTHERYDFCLGLAWTPDGRDILFASPRVIGVLASLSRVSRAGSEPQPALGPGETADQPTIRGSRMVYVQFKPLESALWRVPGRRGPVAPEPQKLIDSSQTDSLPEYSPDGKRIAFISDRAGRGDIWMCDGDGSNAVQLTNYGASGGTPRWSPDGRSLVFDSTKSGSYDLYLVDAEGGLPRRLTHDTSDENVGTWSRNGRFIYFSSDRSRRRQIWRMPAEGGEAVQVTREGGFYGEESWDGRYLYYSPSDDTSGIWRVPTGGGAEVEVVSGEVYWGDWRLVEGGIYFATRQTGARREDYTIAFFDLTSAQVTTVFRESGPLQHRWLAVSPDERWLLYRAEPSHPS